MIEGKQVGDIYHFTTLKSLNMLVDKETLSFYGLEVFEFFSHNDKFSCTRDSCLAQNVMSRDINIKLGYRVRIDLDGSFISDNFKIQPISGLDSNDKSIKSKGVRISKKYQEIEEIVNMKPNKLGDKTFKALKYIKGIVIQNDVLYDKDFNKEHIENVLNDLDIPLRYVRKFNKRNLLDESLPLTIGSHDLEILL